MLVRVDFNVPQGPDGQVADDRRIVEALPTLKHLEAAGARTILISHLGRPDGKRDMRYSLRPVARVLSRHLGLPVPLAEDCVGISALNAAARLTNGQFLLLENLRFHPGEEANDPAFAASLAQLGDVFVQEAFGTLHRAHASTVGLPKRLPTYAGFLVQKEVRELDRLLTGVERPYAAILGGAKVSDKLPLLASLVGRCDTLLLGGALVFPFLTAAGASLGATHVETGLDSEVKAFLDGAKESGAKVVLPTDLVVERDGSKEVEVVAVSSVPPDATARDIGPKSRADFVAALASSRTVFWNGPLGLAEDPRFADGTREVLGSLASLPGFHVAAGGDSARIAQMLGVEGGFQYVSTGGGAALEFVEGTQLPGLTAIPDA